MDIQPFNSYLEQITQFLDEGLLILDAEGRTTFLNVEAERILGWTLAELGGTIAHYKIHYQGSEKENEPLEMCPVHKTIQDGQIYRVKEGIFIHRDGRLLSVSFVSSPLRINGHIIGSVTLFKEIGNRQELEREIKQAQDIALETARLKAEFLANMSHEIRTPINGVIGMANLLLDSKLNREQRDLAITTRDSAQALLTIANDILDFSRIESGKLDIKSEDFRPLKIVEEVSGLLTPQAQRKNLTIMLDVSNKIPNILQGDPARIRQVLLNLVGNAIKFTKKGGVVIGLRIEKKNKTRAFLRFSITDTGIGIPKSAQHRLFQPFTQVDGSSTRPYGGTGLGLSIANRLVELMGGQIGYESRKERGSLFWFVIPLARSNEPIEVENPSSFTSKRLLGVKILIVDPQQTSQTVLLNQLLRWNMKGTSVESCAEISTYLKHEFSTGSPCHLVLVSSPPGDKIQVENDFSVVRSLIEDPELPPVRLVLCTDNTEKKFLEEARQAGYAAILSKPLLRDRLLECLLSQLDDESGASLSPAVDAHSSQRLAAKEQSEKGFHILLAEDNIVIQKVAQTQLHHLGYTVHTVANGEEAVKFMQSDQCALILMDCHMPIMDGYQASKTIRSLAVGHNSVPIIGMVAKTMKGEQQRCLEVGMSDVITKPVQTEHLRKILHQWLPKEPSQKS